MHFDRLRVVSALPPDGGWRSDLAIDRSASPPRAVLVVRVPPAVAGDALSLSFLARGVDLASRIQHPALRRLLGTGEVEGELVLVEAWREGETLRGLLDAGGPLTPELAARLAVDLAGALHAGHTLPAAMGRPLCHGAVRAERVLLTEGGEVLLCGMGRPFAEEASPEDDLRNLARLVAESLPPAGGDVPGPLTTVIDRVLVGEGYPTAAAFAVAVAEVVTPADKAVVVARVEASQSEGMPVWLAHRRALAQALRAEDGAAAQEVASTAAQVEAVRTPPAAPPSPGEHPAVAVAPPPARSPPAAEPQGPQGPALSPPPLPSAVVPSAASAVRVVEPAPADEEADEDADEASEGDGEFIEVIHPERPAGRPGTAADPLAAWLDHPRAPLLVGATLGLVGLLLGFALGGR